MAFSGPRNWPPLDEINGEHNVKYHGATGNGSTDDTPAFRAAVGAAQRLNGVVSIPAGVYRVSNLQVPDNIRLIGENATLKALVAESGNGAPIIDVTGVNVGVFGLKFDGDAVYQPADGYSDSYNSGAGGTGRAYRAGIKADGTVHTLGGLRIEGCEFTNLYGAGIATQNLTDVIIANNYAHNTRFEMAFLYGSTLVNRNAIITGNLLRNIGSGHASVNANGILISGYKRSSITGNVGYTVERNFVKIEAGDDVAVSGNAFHTNSIDSFGGIQTQGNSNRIAIVGNVLTNCGAGVTLNHNAGGQSIVVAGNTIDTTTGTITGDGISLGAADLYDAVIANNVLRNIARIGVYLAYGGARVRVAGNVLYGQGAGNGIVASINSDMSDLDISDNLCYNFVKSAVLGGVIDIERLNGHTYTRLFVQNNKVDAGDDANRAIYVVAGTIAGGIVSNNYVRGGLVGSATGITQRDNDVTGSTTWT